MSTTLIGLSAGVIGTGLGGVLAFFITNPSKRFLSGITGLAAGIMTAIVTFELIPEAFMIGDTFMVAMGIALGTLLLSYLDEFISKASWGRMKRGEGYIKTAVLIGMGVALHNFPEGLAIGSGFAAYPKLGISLAIVIALHNMPEGVAMITPLKMDGYSSFHAFLWTLLAGVPMGLGAFMGVLIGEYAYTLIGISLAFAGGTMLYISFGELIPKAKELYPGKTSTFFAIMGFILGMWVCKRF